MNQLTQAAAGLSEIARRQPEEINQMPMPVEQALGTLIVNANPYTTGAVGTMGFAAAPPAQIDPDQIQVEEDNYAAQWTFKGVTQNIKRSLRIQYRYDKLDANGKPLGYQVTEHLIVGFAGSNGG